MRFRKWQTALVCLVALRLVAFAPVRRGRASVASVYTVTDLGVLNGDQKSVAYALDGCGRIAGVSILNQNDSATPRHPVLWDDSQQPQPTPSPVIDMGTLGGNNATAFALNGFAVAVGDSSNASDDRHAFIWHDDNGNHQSDPGEMKDLGTLPGDSLSQAYGINDSSQGVGLSENIDGSEHAFIWSNGTMQSIPASNGLTPFRAYAINNDGQIVGVALTASVAAHAYRLSHGTLTDLGTLGGRNNFANGINEAGLVVGNSDVSAGSSSRAFIWFPDTGNKTDLGTLTGGSNSIAYDINASGDAVGSSEVTGGASHAFLWHDANGNRQADAGDMQDLNTLTSGSNWTLQEARSINDSGQIVGYGLFQPHPNQAAQPAAFLLTPTSFTPVPCATPAPSSISNVSGSGVFNSTATLTATLLKSGNTPLSGKTVSFTLNGNPVCVVGGTPACPSTDSNGVATLAGEGQ